MITDLLPIYHGPSEQSANLGSLSAANLFEEPNDDGKKFLRLAKDFKQPIYTGSSCSKSSMMVKLLHIKSSGQWNNESFTMLFEFLISELLPSV